MVKRDFIRNILLLLILIVGAVLLRIFVFRPIESRQRLQMPI